MGKVCDPICDIPYLKRYIYYNQTLATQVDPLHSGQLMGVMGGEG